MSDALDANRLRKVTDDMIVAITHPAFVDVMRQMIATPPERRLEFGSTMLTPDALRARGVPLPEGMRMTSRYFETGAPTLEAIDAAQPGGKATVNVLPYVAPAPGQRTSVDSQGGGIRVAGGCVGGGAATVCACGGVSFV